MNLVVLMGRFTTDPTVTASADGSTKIARFNIAVDRKYMKDGNRETDFISCVAFGKTSDFVEKYFHKGMKALVSGRWQTGSYEKEGRKIYTNDCVVENIEFCEQKLNEPNKGESNGFVQADNLEDEGLPFN